MAAFSELTSRATHFLGWQGNIKLRRHKFVMPSTNSDTRHLRLAFASDFHAGPLTSNKLLNKALGLLEEQKPDVVLLGGDYVTQHAHNIEPLCKLLGNFHPPLGIYAVLGNHDLWAGNLEITSQLECAGVHVLTNTNARLPPPYNEISICGIDDPDFGNPLLSQALDSSSSMRILLMHSPNGVHLLGNEKIDLVLCGHTHGGQIVLPNGFAPYVPEGPGCRKYTHGCFKLTAQNGDLLVSKGVGCSLLPIRLFAKSEVHICEISWHP